MSISSKVYGFIGGAVSSLHDIYLELTKLALRPAFSITSHMTKHERVKLYELSADADSVAEIGSYIGASACCFGAAMLKKERGKIICIDTWNNDAMSEGNRDTWSEFQNNTQKYRDFIIPTRGFSTEVIDQVSEQFEKLDVLFIDGDHSYEGVKADWDSYRKLLGAGSIVIFHDYGWAEGVKKVVHENVMPYVHNHGSLPNMWWGTLSKKP